MSPTPIATPVTPGRIFDTDWSIANVAKLLRANAGRGVWNEENAAGSTRTINQHYLRTASARHQPSGVSLLFIRLRKQNCWYASLCFDNGQWNAEVAELWLKCLFGEDRHLITETKAVGSARQFILAMPE
jgi:hypothetical protein